MKHKLLTAPLMFLALMYSCHAQNGPTQPTVALTWTQSNSTGITENCIYRSTGGGTTPAPPAIFCSLTPITTYTDSTVAANTTVVYAVTAKVGQTESGYSVTAQAVIPANPNPPTGLTAPTITKNLQPNINPSSLEAIVVWKEAPHAR